MKVRFLGHAAFEIALDSGAKLVFDPYESGAYDGALAYGPIEDSYDYAVISHDHADHCCDAVISKAAHVVNSTGEFDFGEIKVKTLATFHDESDGSERGTNRIAVIEAEGLKLAHLGDLGHGLSDELASELRGVDVLFVPVGGYYTINASAAASVVAQIDPTVVIPMHFKTGKVDFPIETVDTFAALMDNVERTGASEIKISRDDLPGSRKVVVLDPAL